MEKMPFQPDLTRGEAPSGPATPTPSTQVTTSAWQQALPILSGPGVTLRELRPEDAPSLLAMISTEEVARFISPPPTTLDGYERFIAWAIRERERGNYVCFAVVPDGMTTAVGLFQIRSLEAGFATAEWGFALGSGYWGTGLFAESARLVLDFSFDVLNVYRLEARASLDNGRGNGALRKLGAVQEGILRQSFLRFGQYHDQALWSVLADDWCLRRGRPRPQVH
jgi:RimJ/RimL family protein N-acetyltransferase